MQEPTVQRIPTASLWFGLIAAPAAWSIHMLAVWLVVEIGCALGLGETQFLGVNSIHALVLLSTIIGSVITAAAGIVAYQNWQRLGETLNPAHETETRAVGRARFMSVVGMSFSALFLLVILYMTVPVFVLPAC